MPPLADSDERSQWTGIEAPNLKYYFRIETGEVQDLAGNDMLIVVTEGYHTIEIDAEGDADVQRLYSDPCHNCDSESETLRVYFPEALVVQNLSGYNSTDVEVTLTDCGDDFVCSEDDPTVRFLEALSTEWSTGWPSLPSAVIQLGALAPRRYKVHVPRGVFQRQKPDSWSGADFAVDVEAFSLEFVHTSPVEFQHRRSGWVSPYSVQSDASSIQQRSFMLPLPLDLSPGHYDVCYCDDQLDRTLKDLKDKGPRPESDFATTYRLSTSGTALSMSDLPASMAEEACETKCTHGCEGDDCHCGSEAWTPNTLCLSAAKCRAMCDELVDSCAGVRVTDGERCELLESTIDADDLSPVGILRQRTYEVYSKVKHTACTHTQDFSDHIGTLSVTNRVEVGLDYVLRPGQPQSLELVGNFGAAPDLLADRIMVVEKDGTCGRSPPAEGVHSDQNWATLPPMSWWHDYPHEDAQNRGPRETAVGEAARRQYNRRDGGDMKRGFCPGNIDIHGQRATK